MIKTSEYTQKYLDEVHSVVDKIDASAIDKMIDILRATEASGGRIFVLGVGGSAANASHMVNDLRKICGLEVYAPTDNVSELTARTNDDGWDSVFSNWLKISRLRREDVVMILSVGGGNLEKNVSPNLVKAIDFAKARQAKIVGIVGRDGGYTAKRADACVIVPTVNPETVTPHVEAFQAVIWHLIVSHPDMKRAEMKWESVK